MTLWSLRENRKCSQIAVTFKGFESFGFSIIIEADKRKTLSPIKSTFIKVGTQKNLIII